MKKQLYFYVAMIIGFIAYNQFFVAEDERLNTIINIIFTSFLFFYIAYIAYTVLKRLKNTRKK